MKGFVQIMMIGIDKARLPFEVNAQLAHRAEPPIEFNVLDMSNDEDYEFYLEFLSRYLTRIEKTGVILNATTLLSKEIAGKIHDASGGVLGVACNIIKAAVKIAVDEGRDVLSMDDLALANDEMIAKSNEGDNHFRVENISTEERFTA